MALQNSHNVFDSEIGISSTTLDFGVYSKITWEAFWGKIFQHANFIWDCENIVMETNSRRTKREKVKVHNTPSAKEVQNVRELPLSHSVLGHSGSIG